jgi:hypothetical protein
MYAEIHSCIRENIIKTRPSVLVRTANQLSRKLLLTLSFLFWGFFFFLLSLILCWARMEAFWTRRNSRCAFQTQKQLFSNASLMEIMTNYFVQPQTHAREKFEKSKKSKNINTGASPYGNDD